MPIHRSTVALISSGCAAPLAARATVFAFASFIASVPALISDPAFGDRPAQGFLHPQLRSRRARDRSPFAAARLAVDLGRNQGGEPDGNTVALMPFR